MIRLFTTLYNESCSARRMEYETCLHNNVVCSALTEIIVFSENANFDLQHENIKVVPVNSRPSYSQFFEYVNEIVRPGEVSIIANGDIYFDERVRALEYISMDNTCLALSRWNIASDGSPRLFNRLDSQDCWIFRGRIKPVTADFCLGVPRCDNRIAYELEQAGYHVLNPSFSIRSYHLHSGERGEYNADNLPHFVPPPYKYVWPHNLYGMSHTVVHNLRHRHSRLGYRVDWRRLRQLLPHRVWRQLGRA